MLGRELDQRRERLLNNVRRAIRAYRGVLADADRLARQDGEIELAVTQCRRADVAWELAQQRFREATTHYNRKLLDYNLKLPPGMAQRTPLDLEREVVRLLQNL